VFVDQMQFLFSRLASPTVVDFDDGNDTLSADDQTSSEHLHPTVLPPVGLQQQQDYSEKTCHSSVSDSTQKEDCTGQQAACTERCYRNGMPSMKRQQDCAQKSSGLADMPTVTLQQHCVRQQPDCTETSCHINVPQRQGDTEQQPALCQSGVRLQSDRAEKSCGAAVMSDTESLVSLNELLDGCQCDTDAGETFAIDSYDVDDFDCSQPTISHLFEIINILHVSVDSDVPNVDHVRQISENGLSRLALNARPRKSIFDTDELTGLNEATPVGASNAARSNSQSVSSPLMQRSFAESNTSTSSSSSDKAHVDTGYHSNATSAASQEATVYDDKSFMSPAVLPVSM